MKKTVLIVGLSALIISCNQANKQQENNESNAVETSVEANEGKTEEANSSAE